MMNPVPWLQMTNMISYQGLVRTFLSLDPVKDIQAELLQLEAGIKSKTQVIAELGGDPVKVLAEVQAEKEKENPNKEVNQDGNQKPEEGTNDTPTGD